MMIFKSKLYREEIKHWLVIVLSICFGIVGSIHSIQSAPQTLLIGIDESGVRLIKEGNDRLLQVELKQFLKYFLDQYYTYNSETFKDRLGFATELMSFDLWEREKPKLLEIQEKLNKAPLSQFSEIENIDLVEYGKIEALIRVKIKSRLNENELKLRVFIRYQNQMRNEKNPWNFEITELSDAVL